jgi:hypothetical protein
MKRQARCLRYEFYKENPVMTFARRLTLALLGLLALAPARAESAPQIELSRSPPFTLAMPSGGRALRSTAR